MDTPSARRIMAEAAAAAVSQVLLNRRAGPAAAARYAPAANTTSGGASEYGYDPNRYEEPTFFGILPFLVRILRLLCIGGVLCTLSIGSYLVFYQNVMPSRYATEPLFFDYSGSHPPSFNPWRRRPHWENDHDVAWASVDLFAKQSHWDALQKECLPQPVAQDRLLEAQEAYYIDVSLVLPESDLNRVAGIFNVVTELHSHNGRRNNGTQIAISKRSTRFPYQSPWISVLRKVVLLFPLMMGAIEESRTVVIPAFRHFVEIERQPLQYVLVKIVTSPVAAMRNQTVEVLGGEVWIGKEMNACQEILKEWFYACAFVGSCLFAVFYMTLWTVLQIAWDMLRLQFFYLENEEPPCDLDMDADDMDDPVFDDFPFFDHQQATPPSANGGRADTSGTPNPQRQQQQPGEQDDPGDATSWEDWEDLFHEAQMNEPSPTVTP